MIKSRRIRWARHVARMGRSAMNILYWWESQKERNHVKLDLRERGWVGMDRIDLTQDRDQWRALVSTVMNFSDP
jgi:hypothetical protein